MGAGEHSAAYTGTVVDLEPIPRPKTKRAMKRLTHELATPSHCTNNTISDVDSDYESTIENEILGLVSSVIQSVGEIANSFFERCTEESYCYE
jgi:cytochrome c-type biogenesis protein CcmH/NrfF